MIQLSPPNLLRRSMHRYTILQSVVNDETPYDLFVFPDFGLI